MTIAASNKGSIRAHVTATIKALAPKRVVLPGAGNFDLAVAAVDAGIQPCDLYACDITLYSSAIGHYLSTGEALKVSINHPTVSWLQPFAQGATPSIQTACTVLGLRYVGDVHRKASRQRDAILREMREQAPAFLRDINSRLLSLAERLHGIQYRTGDLRPVVDQAARDHDTLIVLSPPHTPGEHKDSANAKINGVLQWRSPGVGSLDPSEDLPAIVDCLARGLAPALLRSTDDLAWGDPADMYGDPWRSVMVETQRVPTGSLAHWLCCNQPDRVPSAMTRKDVPNRFWAAKYRLFHGEITPRSRLEVRTERVEVVNYYRDLLQHRLGLFGGTTQRMVLLLDGMLIAVLGFIQDHWLIDPARPMINVYCFAAPHARYNLQKLAVYAQHSSWFWDGLYDDLRGNPTTIHTTMWTRHPSSMQARGIMKLAKREETASGEYQLLYTGDVKPRTARQCLSEYMQKWGSAA